MNPLTPYLIWIKLGAGVALCASLYGIGHHNGSGSTQAKWDKASAAQVVAENAAILKRTSDNAALAAKQSETNASITKAKDEELAPVRARIAADRVRVGPSLCRGFAAPAEAKSPGISDAADSPGRLVSPELESRIRELEIRVEEALATGRACQAFITENGMAQ